MDFVLDMSTGSFFSLCGRAGGPAGGGGALRTDLYRENFCVVVMVGERVDEAVGDVSAIPYYRYCAAVLCICLREPARASRSMILSK